MRERNSRSQPHTRLISARNDHHFGQLEVVERPSAHVAGVVVLLLLLRVHREVDQVALDRLGWSVNMNNQRTSCGGCTCSDHEAVGGEEVVQDGGRMKVLNIEPGTMQTPAGVAAAVT